jgi:serine/threonine-protein kinase
VRLFQGPGGAHFAISDGGTLAYIRGKEEMFSESFVADRTGRRVIGLDGAGATGDPTFSPDGTRLALTLYRGGSFGIGVFDIGRGQVTPVSFSRDNIAPNWTAKGDQVTFVSNRDGDYNLYAIRSDGSGVPEPLSAESQGFSNSRSAWSRDGRHLAYDRSGASGWDIWVLESGGGARPRPLLATPAVESAPTFSPDGRFIAYQSDESGTFEVYVRPFPDVDTGRIVISRAGGRRPVWSRDGRNVFYFSADGLMQAPVASGADGLPRFGQPSLVFKMSGIRNFDVSPDGQTFAIQRTPIETLAREIHVVTNWYEELKRLVPAN